MASCDEVHPVRFSAEPASGEQRQYWALPETAPAQALFEALAAVNHPAIARHVALRELAGNFSLVTEALPTRTLQDQLDEHGPLPISAALQLALRLCDGLRHVHALGLVHGGICAKAVHLGAGAVVLADFRAARFDADLRTDFADLAEVIAAAAGSGASAELAEVVARCRGTGVPFESPQAIFEALLLAADALSPDDTWDSVPPGSQVIPLTRALERQGDSVGSYVLERLLGEGSMGRVFAARHVRLGRPAAIKLLRGEHSDSREMVQRFFQEARTVNEINHAHIVEVLDFVEETGVGGHVRAYCVMELLEGSSLSALLRGTPLPLARSLRIARQLCEALGAAHRVGVVHRDVKPDNIFIACRDGADFVKVLDFGVAKLVRPMGGLPVGTTVDGAIIGTPSYMSPEQVQGMDVDARADVHAVGVVLYELLTGAVPYTATRFGALAAQIIASAPAPLPPQTAADEPIPEALAELVMELLAKDPHARPASLDLVEQRIAAIVQGRTPQRRRRWQLAAAAMSIALGAAAAVVSAHLHAPQPQPQLATAAAMAELRAATLPAAAVPVPVVAVLAPSEVSIAEPVEVAPPPPPKARRASERRKSAARPPVSKNGVIDPFAE